MIRNADAIIRCLVACLGFVWLFFWSSPAVALGQPTVSAVVVDELDTLDPALFCTSEREPVGRALFEGLIRVSAADGAPEGGLAESWSVVADGLQLRFKLRSHARWSSGKALNAADFSFSWQRLLDLAPDSPPVEILTRFVRGAQAYRDQRESKSPLPFSSVGISVPEENILQVELLRPAPGILEHFSRPCLAPVSSELIARYGRQWSQAEHILTTGPYRIVEWEPQKRLLLKSNPAYWDAQNVVQERVSFSFVQDIQDGLNVFDSQRADWLPLAQVVPTSRLVTHTLLRRFPALHTRFLLFNSARIPLKDSRIRQAISMSISVRSITEGILGYGQPLVQFISSSAVDDLPASEEKQAEIAENARRLLATAGYSGGRGIPVFRLIHRDDDDSLKIATALVAMVTRTLSIAVTTEALDATALDERLSSGNFELALLTLAPDSTDPEAFLSHFSAGTLWRVASGQSLTRFDVLQMRALTSSLLPERQDLWKKADSVLCVEDLAVLPLFRGVHQALMSARIRGFEPSLSGVVRMHRLQILAPTP